MSAGPILAVTNMLSDWKSLLTCPPEGASLMATPFDLNKTGRVINK